MEGIRSGHDRDLMAIQLDWKPDGKTPGAHQFVCPIFLHTVGQTFGTRMACYCQVPLFIILHSLNTTSVETDRTQI